MGEKTLTVLGAAGFIGRHVVDEARRLGLDVSAPPRGEDLRGRELGHVIDCIGLTADFRTRPFDAVDAHVCRTAALLSTCSFWSYVYLSSTRLYLHASRRATEAGPIGVDPTVSDELYNASKLMGESVTLSTAEPARVARLSNVYSLDPVPNSFLTGLVDCALREREVRLRTAMASQKDYLHVRDAARALLHISLHGRHRVYNVASGVNVGNDQLLEALQTVISFRYSVDPDAPIVTFPSIDISRLEQEMSFRPQALVDLLPRIVERHRSELRG